MQTSRCYRGDADALRKTTRREPLGDLTKVATTRYQTDHISYQSSVLHPILPSHSFSFLIFNDDAPVLHDSAQASSPRGNAMLMAAVEALFKFEPFFATATKGARNTNVKQNPETQDELLRGWKEGSGSM